MKFKHFYRTLIPALTIMIGSLGLQAGQFRGRVAPRRPVVQILPARHVYVRPVIGARVRVLPAGYVRVYFGGQPYFHYLGTYYRYCPVERVYVVVEKPQESNS